MKSVSPDVHCNDYKKRRGAFLKELIASTPNVSLRAQEFRRWIDKNSPSPADEPRRILIAEARAVDWDFTHWCYVSGHDASDSDARNMFERLLAYASREGRANLD